MPELTPEQQVRKNIDRMLEAAGWVVQDLKQLNLGAGPGVAVREFPLKTGLRGRTTGLSRAPTCYEREMADFGVLETFSWGMLGR